MILSTKFFIPPAPSVLVNRGRLVDRLISGLRCPLTLISAPAGFGKSTLLCEWTAALVRAGTYRVGWLSLDPQDDTPVLFWAYFLAAWQAAVSAGEQAPETLLPAESMGELNSLLKSEEKCISSQIAGALVHLMIAVPTPVVIILDDYHHIQSPEIHESLAKLIARLPEHVRLAVATRFDPPLTIPRLRVLDQVNEIRAADLRFTDLEISALFQKTPGLPYLEQDIPTIADSTEGWVAGLKMAALALQLQQRTENETRQFWASFTGRNTYILDYLTEEVLAGLSEETQTFLIKTSVLERLTGELCAVVAFEEAASAPQARALLETLERKNLFLIPLDQERNWFRYHHLFADLLRVRLQHRFGDQLAVLHQRAAGWYERSGLVEEAMRHVVAAADWQSAARMIEEHLHSYLERGQLAIVLKWIEALPAELLHSRPNLCIQVSWALGHAGKTHLMGPLLREADSALADWESQQQGALTDHLPIQLTAQDVVRLRAGLIFHRAYRLVLAEQPEQSLRLVHNALETLPDLETREHAWLTWVKGYAMRGLGNVEQAARCFSRAVEIGRAGGREWIDHSIDLAITYRLSGRLEEAGCVLEDCLRINLQDGLQNKGNLSRAEAYLSAVRLEQNRVDEALRHAQSAVNYLQWWPSHNHSATSYAYYAMVLLATGALDQAAEAVRIAQQEQSSGEVTPFVVRLVEMAQVRLWLACQETAAIKVWTESQNDLPGIDPAGTIFSEYQEMHLITLARAWIGLGRFDKDSRWLKEAYHLLEVLAASAQASSRINAAVEIHLLAALACWGLGRTIEALEWCTRSLIIGLPAGCRRVYLNEAPWVLDLLRAWLAKDRTWLEGTGVSMPAALDLTAALSALQSEPAAEVTLVEPLTVREKEVLHCLALGLSNREIAAQLVVSEGTIKTHVHNLIGKLGAQSRTHVLARAREFHLI